MIQRKKDDGKARLLLEMAKITLERLNQSNKERYPSNTLNDYYDILHKLMESLASLKGIKFSGVNAHKKLIDFVCKNFFNEPDRIFLQNIRNFRNQISYEGFNIPPEYIQRNEEKISEYIDFLIKEISKELC
jgi:hypothetical protein